CCLVGVLDYLLKQVGQLFERLDSIRAGSVVKQPLVDVIHGPRVVTVDGANREPPLTPYLRVADIATPVAVALVAAASDALPSDEADVQFLQSDINLRDRFRELVGCGVEDV